MLSPSDFRDLVSGRRRGLAASALRMALRASEVPYALVMRSRNAMYDHGLFQSHNAAVPVVSVGNLTVGGTGKTPLVAWLADWFRQQGVPIGVVSRGYKARDGAPNDEALELARKIPDLPHVQNRDRVVGVREIVDQHDCRVVVLDDAFQHRRIRRDLDLVLLDSLEPFGWDHVLPRGTLREPVAGLARAHVVALSRSDAIPPEQREQIRQRVQQLAPEADWVELVHRPLELISAQGGRQSLDRLADCRAAAFCGIGNPDGFRHTLQWLGCQLAGLRVFPDHHTYPASDLANLEAWMEGLEDVDVVLCTQKDLVKLDRPRLGGRELWAVSIGLDIPLGREKLEHRLQSLIRGQR